MSELYAKLVNNLKLKIKKYNDRPTPVNTASLNVIVFISKIKAVNNAIYGILRIYLKKIGVFKQKINFNSIKK